MWPWLFGSNQASTRGTARLQCASTVEPPTIEPSYHRKNEKKTNAPRTPPPTPPRKPSDREKTDVRNLPRSRRRRCLFPSSSRPSGYARAASASSVKRAAAPVEQIPSSAPSDQLHAGVKASPLSSGLQMPEPKLRPLLSSSAPESGVAPPLDPELPALSSHQRRLLPPSSSHQRQIRRRPPAAWISQAKRRLPPEF